MKIVTASGAIIPLLGDFKPDIYDIAHALSGISRYNSHTSIPYSVAQHSVLVSEHVPNHLKYQALMHDAHEAYTTDMPYPIKETVNHITQGKWDEFENRIASHVRHYFGLPANVNALVKEADKKLYANEIGSLFNEKAKSSFNRLGWKPSYDIKIVPLSQQDSYKLFMDTFKKYTNGIGL